ncbi:MAG: hypothetical protein QOD60_2006 [Solirubrobacterales bacterium]|jgi:hypothetical protein|nr:hypothetical protein [Solirubrobacterales bacterium]
MTGSRYVGSLAALLTSGALVAGCGGSSDNSTTNPLSQSEFVAKASAICETGGKQIEQAAAKYLGGGRPTPQDFEQFVDKAVVPDTQQQIDQFRQLTPPASETDTYATLVDGLQSVTDKLKANPQLLAQSGDPFAGTKSPAKQLGLDACAKS